MQITCANCGEAIEIPPELLGDTPDITLLEPYVCDACENRRDDEADDLDHFLGEDAAQQINAADAGISLLERVYDTIGPLVHPRG